LNLQVNAKLVSPTSDGLDGIDFSGSDLDAIQHYVPDDYGRIHQELRRKGITLMLLWQKHSERHPDATNNSYSQFCENEVDSEIQTAV
jgi:hypothetical protein